VPTTASGNVTSSNAGPTIRLPITPPNDTWPKCHAVIGAVAAVTHHDARTACPSPASARRQRGVASSRIGPRAAAASVIAATNDSSTPDPHHRRPPRDRRQRRQASASPSRARRSRLAGQHHAHHHQRAPSPPARR
jgi:hypothetical protein